MNKAMTKSRNGKTVKPKLSTIPDDRKEYYTTVMQFQFRKEVENSLAPSFRAGRIINVQRRALIKRGGSEQVEL